MRTLRSTRRVLRMESLDKRNLLTGDCAVAIEDGVLDIYEEHFGKEETELKLARAVHLTARVKHSRGFFSMAMDLARRARRIYEHYGPLAGQSVAHCLRIEEEAFESLGDLEERMESDQEALEIKE